MLSKENNNYNPKKPTMLFGRPITPVFSQIPYTSQHNSLNLKDLTQEYKILCQLEQTKLHKLEKIIKKKHNVESEFVEFIGGKTMHN